MLENHPALRLGYRECLDADPRLRITYEDGLDEQAFEDLASNPPDLLIVGLDRNKREGLAFLRRASRRLPGIRTLVISPHQSPRYMHRANRAGADKYLCWEHASDELLMTSREMLGGKDRFSGHGERAPWQEIRQPIREHAGG